MPVYGNWEKMLVLVSLDLPLCLVLVQGPGLVKHLVKLVIASILPSSDKRTRNSGKRENWPTPMKEWRDITLPSKVPSTFEIDLPYSGVAAAAIACVGSYSCAVATALSG